MGKKFAQVLAVLHFMVTELRPVWLLWYTIYITTENIVTSDCVADAYKNSPVTSCLYDGKLTVYEMEKCGSRAYRRYLADGVQNPFRPCAESCPNAGVYITAPVPRILLFFLTAWLVGTYVSCIQARFSREKFSLK